eukprot:766662_1
MKHFWQRKEPLLPITNPIVNTRKDSEPSICAQPIKFYVLFSFICLVVLLFVVCMKTDFSLLGYSGEPEQNAAGGLTAYIGVPDQLNTAPDLLSSTNLSELNTAPDVQPPTNISELNTALGVQSSTNVPESSTAPGLLSPTNAPQPSTAPGPKPIFVVPQLESSNVSGASTLNTSVTSDVPEFSADQRNSAPSIDDRESDNVSEPSLVPEPTKVPEPSLVPEPTIGGRESDKLRKPNTGPDLKSTANGSGSRYVRANAPESGADQQIPSPINPASKLTVGGAVPPTENRNPPIDGSKKRVVPGQSIRAPEPSIVAPEQIMDGSEPRIHALQAKEAMLNYIKEDRDTELVEKSDQSIVIADKRDVTVDIPTPSDATERCAPITDKSQVHQIVGGSMYLYDVAEIIEKFSESKSPAGSYEVACFYPGNTGELSCSTNTAFAHTIAANDDSDDDGDYVWTVSVPCTGG